LGEVTVAILLAIGGTFMILTARQPTRNVFTHALYELWRAWPRPGFGSVEGVLLVNGIGLLTGAAVLALHLTMR
jgi:hypothetical protein